MVTPSSFHERFFQPAQFGPRVPVEAISHSRRAFAQKIKKERSKGLQQPTPTPSPRPATPQAPGAHTLTERRNAKAGAVCASARRLSQNASCTCRSKRAKENSWCCPATHCSSVLRQNDIAGRRPKPAGRQKKAAPAPARRNRPAHPQNTGKAAHSHKSRVVVA